MASEIVPYVWKRFSSLTFVQDTHRKVFRAAGVSKEVENIAKNFKDILAVLPDAEAREMQEPDVRDWLNEVKKKSYDMNDTFDEYSTLFLELRIVADENPLLKKKVCFFFLAPHFFTRAVALCSQTAVMIKEIDKKLDDIVKWKVKHNLNVSESTEKQIQITFSFDLSEIYGRNEEKMILVSKLLGEGTSIISIVGMEGIGKTTLAQFAYNNNEVIRNFSQRIWVDILGSEDKCIIKFEGLNGSCSESVEYDVFNKTIHKSIKDKKFLLVLNDMKIKGYYKMGSFDSLKYGGLDGSKILITTSHEKSVASKMMVDDIITINELSEKENWSLFTKLAFSKRSIEECESLKEIGQEIVRKCKGLPLAIQIMGSLLRFKTSIKEWAYILENEVWNVEKSKGGFLPVFSLSYNDLPSMIRLCFAYCAIFPKDYKMKKDELIKLWMAQGYLGLEPNIEMEILGQRLRSLFITCKDDDYSLGNDILPELFGNLACIRALKFDASGDFIKEIPAEIGKLIQLRYLDLSGQKIKKLPETLCALYHLQSLDISWCQELEELPQAMGKLINLRHLLNDYTDSLSYMPRGVGRLTYLRTLSEFIVSGSGNGTHDNKACNLESLKALNNLQGNLLIRGLENVTDVGEAKKSQLEYKKNLSGLGVNFGESEGEKRMHNDEKLLELLKPPPTLEKFDIQLYRGSTFPSSWMMSLTRLRHLKLYRCINCKQLSTLGKLPSLESLRISNMSSVKRVDDNFWGIESDGRSSSSSSTILFPKLKFLKFSDMEEWEEWDYKITREGEEKECTTIMPCLASLKANFCGKLKALPDDLLQKTTLKKLEFYECPVLRQYFKKRLEEHYPQITHISSIKIDGQYVQEGPDH